MEATVIAKLFIVCPFCEKGDTRIDHLPLVGTKFGPWYCNECGHCYQGVRTETGATLEKLEQTKKSVMALLRYVHDPRLLLIVEAETYSEFPDPGHAYYYGQHTCPTNFLRDVKQVILRDGDFDDHDPHGVFQFVRYATEKDLDDDTVVELEKVG